MPDPPAVSIVVSIIVGGFGIVLISIMALGKWSRWQSPLIAAVGLLLIYWALLALRVQPTFAVPWTSVVGSILVLIGLAVTLMPVWKLYNTGPPANAETSTLEWANVLAELIKKLPWVALVGLLMIYAGLVTLGVEFP